MPSYPPGPRLNITHLAPLFRDPIGHSESLRRRYGPVFRLRFPGFPPEVFVTTAELAEQVYGLDVEGGRAGELRRQALEPMVGRNSLLTLDGEPWRRHRKLLTPPLHGRAVAGYREQIARIAAEDIAGWPLGTPFALRDRTQRITLEVILRLVFGISDNERLGRLRELLPRLLDAVTPSMLLMPPWLVMRLLDSPVGRRVPFLPTTRFAALREAVDRLLYAEIARRRERFDPEATDVMSRLLAARDEDGEPLSDTEVRDELVTMLAAGHETTATALAWAFERMTRAPQVLERLRAELDAGENGDYLEAVVKETLRCRPVVFDVPRLVDRPMRLGGFDVPAGWLAAPLLGLIHRDPEVYPEPDAFRPERFLGEREEVARAQKSWQPFGGGRRYCVGAQLALLELRVIIREVMERVELAAVDPAPERQRFKHVTLVPAHRARVMARARRPAELTL